jgi:hypothetical protein
MSKVSIFSWALVGMMGFVPLAMGQDDPPAKPVPNAFDLPAKAEPREKAGPIIKLSQPLGPEATLEERLQAKGTFQADEVPLKEFADALAAALDTSVVLAVKKLEDAGINTETPVVCKLKNVKVQTALRLILGELGLTFVTHDDVIMITTPEDAGSQLVTRVYDCRDLMKLPSPVRRVKKMPPAPQQSGIGTPEVPAKTPDKKSGGRQRGQFLQDSLCREINMVASAVEARLAALALAGFCLLAALVFHTGFGERNQLLHFILQLPLQLCEFQLRLADLRLEIILLLGAQPDCFLMLNHEFWSKKALSDRILIRLLCVSNSTREKKHCGQQSLRGPQQNIRSA